MILSIRGHPIRKSDNGMITKMLTARSVDLSSIWPIAKVFNSMRGGDAACAVLRAAGKPQTAYCIHLITAALFFSPFLLEVFGSLLVEACTNFFA